MNNYIAKLSLRGKFLLVAISMLVPIMVLSYISAHLELEKISVARHEDEGLDCESSDDNDELFQEAIELVKRSGHASASFLQRHLKVCYNRAARMIETMESRDIGGPADGARPREVLMR